ncbi:MAG: hypothetical protein UT66_C0007G0006 [candidate division CPR2 bacterium GW2011_GWC1_39_9]|nr:MAG: hypothetical protein UT66_C0007G0006 [candidate division CPR2 bacterium GW2011_GWC1_39_9]
MRKKILFLIVLTAISVGLFFIFVNQTKAADETNISISPLTFDLSANPGDTVTNELLVRNSSSDPVVISVEAQDFVATGEEGEVNLTDSKTTYSLASWVELDSDKFTLAGGQKKSVKFVIRVPFNAEPGGHYASVYTHLSPTTGDATSGSGVGQKIGSLVLLRVGGTANEEAKIATFKTTKESYAKGPVDFDVRIENTGSVHVKPKGIIAVTDMWGKKVADVTVDQKNVLPGAIRHMTAKWENTPRFGKYTASLLTYYGNENKQLTAAATFWIIPWMTILIWAVISVAAIVIIWLLRGRLKSAFKAFLKSK